MRKIFLVTAFLGIAILASAQAKIELNPSETLRPIGLMHGVGGGPGGAATVNMYKAAGIPFIRLHDISGTHAHCVDILEIFPNFDADENDPASYDFLMTDAYIKSTVATGAHIIWRLGNSHHEPTAIKKYGAWPPKDFSKWARICSHVIAHYNEGWADGFHYNIEYWEIWNEPDGDQGVLSKSENIQEKDKDKVGVAKRYEVAPHSWGGTMEEYYNLFATTAKLIRKEHPYIKIGGPANAGFKYNEPFLKAMAKRDVKLDFFSWHRYSQDPETLSEEGHKVRELLDNYGYKGILTVLDEWNYQSGWDSDNSKYSAAVRASIKGAAYTAACMCHMQSEACTDVLTYYDWRYSSSYNGAFNHRDKLETATYYVFYNWNKLLQYGSQIAHTCYQNDIYVTAARNEEGKVRMMVVRYNDKESQHLNKKMYVPIPEGCKSFKAHLSDSAHMNCEYPFAVTANGVELVMEPESVVFLEFE